MLFRSNLTELYNKQIRLIMELPTMSPEELDEYENGEYEEESVAEETAADETVEAAEEETSEKETSDEENADNEQTPVTDSEQVEKILNTGSFDPVIPKTSPSDLKFGKNN